MWPTRAPLLFFSFPLITLLGIVESKFYKTNITDFSKCKVYYSRTGSVYRDFFEIVEGPTKGNGTLLLDFHFSVLASSDAHILLAPSRNVDKADPVYEIVVGAGGNTFCDIRRMQKSSVKATILKKGLLSALDPRSFWIHMTKDGVLEVGKEGEELAFLSWIDPDPLPLTVFSFSTWSGVEAKWYFDCIREENENSSTKLLEREMTPLEKLRKDFLFRLDPYVRPVKNFSSITQVGMRITETSLVTLDEYRSVMEFRGTVQLSWQDEKLVWDPENYSGIGEMHIFRREIWVPDLYLFNSADSSRQELLEDTLVVVNSSGFAFWKTKANLNTWCSLDDFSNWPRDQHLCYLVVGFFKDYDVTQLVFDLDQSNFDSTFSSRWQTVEFDVFSNIGWTDIDDSADSDFTKFDPPGLNLQFLLKRTSNSYTIVLFTPFFVVAVSLLLTFWVSPFGPWKISLSCLQLILCTLMLIVIAFLMPTHCRTSPNILLLYSCSLIAIVLSICLETIVIKLSREEQAKALPHCVKEILTSCFLKMLLGLPELKSPDEYGNLDDSTPKLAEEEQSAWILLGVAIDRVAFFVYLGLSIYAFCLTY